MAAGDGPAGPEEVQLWDVFARPSIARIYDCLLGGKDNIEVDREVAAHLAEVQPLVVAGARANRAFVRRATAFLAKLGIAQYIDLGSGLPTGLNVHEVAQRVNPDAKVVYVDNDPIVLVHGRALLEDNHRTIVVEGDIREPEQILADRQVRDLINVGQPIAVLCAAILHFVGDDAEPAGIVRTFADVMAPGSALVISHVVDDGEGERAAATRESAAIYSETTAPFFSELPAQPRRTNHRSRSAADCASARRPTRRSKSAWRKSCWAAMPRMSAARSGGTVLTAISSARRAPKPGVQGSPVAHNKLLTCGDMEWFSQQIVVRSRAQVAAWFDGFRLVPPGLVDADQWQRAGNGKITAPIVAGVGVLDPPGGRGASPEAVGVRGRVPVPARVRGRDRLVPVGENGENGENGERMAWISNGMPEAERVGSQTSSGICQRRVVPPPRRAIAEQVPP
jgi:hypothetical protein